MQVWWQSRSPTIKGTWLMILSVLFFTLLLLLIRITGEAVSVFVMVLVRQAIMQVIVLVQAGKNARFILRTGNIKLQLLRSAFALGSTLAIFISFVHLPLALASAISFSAVLFVTLGAALILKEEVGPRAWAATIIGLIGVLIMLSPREGGDLFYVLIAVGGAIVSAGTILTVRVFHPSESIGTVLTYQGILVLPVLGIPAVLTWQPISLTTWALLIAIGFVSTAGHWTFVAAYRHAEAARLAPLDFLRLVLLSIAGFLFFNEQPEPSLAIGMLIVVATTFYTIRSNAKVAAERAELEAVTAS
jgi:drug/metabolite transporter (DMT)-like permease